MVGPQLLEGFWVVGPHFWTILMVPRRGGVFGSGFVNGLLHSSVQALEQEVNAAMRSFESSKQEIQNRGFCANYLARYKR